MKKEEIKTLDNLWQKLIKLKAHNACEYCRRKDTLNSHHIFSRSNKATRWDEDNGVCLCAGHHTLNIISVHKSPIEFIEWLKEKRGETWYISLRLRANTVQKHDYQLLKLYLEKEIKKYK